MFGLKKKVPAPITKGVCAVPVVMQMEALECGAASLTMIMHYYKNWIPLEQARVDCGVSMDGASAKNILVAARRGPAERGALPLHYPLGLQPLCGAVRLPGQAGSDQRPGAGPGESGMGGV